MVASVYPKNWACLPGPAGPPIASRSASEPRERRHRSHQKQRPKGRKTAPLWVRPGSPAPPGLALSLEGTGGARKASLPPGSLSLLPPGARAPLALCETLAALGDEWQISQHEQRSGTRKNICENLSHLWMPARSLRSE